MKKWIAIAFVLLMLFVCACAEDAAKEEFYSAPDDLCFHQHPACSGRNDLELIADTTGLFPCHICADDPNPHEEPEAFALGDFVIIRVPDKWMRERPDIDTIFASWDKECYADYEADAVISEYLHGADYRNFLNSNGFPTYAYIPGIFGTKQYNQRHIGDSWYAATYLPVDGNGSLNDNDYPWRMEDAWHGYLRFFGGRMWQQDGITCFYEPAEWRDSEYSMPIKAMSETPIFEDKQNGIDIKIYAHEDFYLFVADGIRDQEYYERMTALIGGLPVCSWIQEQEGTACFVLTEAEAYQILNGFKVKLVDSIYEIKDFRDSDYAIIGDSSFFTGFQDQSVIDKFGNELLNESYSNVARHGNVFFCALNTVADALLPAGMYVYDFSKSSEPLFTYSIPDTNIYLASAWDNAFLLDCRGDCDGYLLCDIHTGEILKEISYEFGMSGKYFDMIGTRYVYTDGNSERVCWMHSKTVYLADNHMNLIAEIPDCPAILPLTWSGDNGLFLLVYGSDAWQLPVYSALFKHGFDAGDYYRYFGEFNYNDPWEEHKMSYEEYLEYMDSEISDITFALVNENGEFVTDAPFTYIRVIDEKQVEIGNRDGMRMIVETER